MKRKLLISTCLLGSASCIWAEKNSLNVVYILADDMGYGDVSCYNSKAKLSTPTLDALAASGMAFMDAHSNAAVSTPTRYGTMTGRYSFRSSLKKGVLTGYSAPIINNGRETVASFLKAAGYQTACIGKWHLGLNWSKKDSDKPLFTGTEWDLGDTSNVDYTARISGGPSDCGFDYSYILPASLDMSPYVYIENGKITAPVTRYADDYRDEKIRGAHYRHGDMADDFDHNKCLFHLTQKSVDYILEASRKDEPYFLYCALTAPHSPWLVDDAFEGKSEAGAYGDFVAMTDEAVRRIWEAVKKSGKADKTLIIFTTDNGAMWQKEDIRQTGHYANGIWNGAKSDIWEGGHRVPMIAACPGVVPEGSKSNVLVSSTDLFATLAEMSGIEIPDGTAEDSFSYWKTLCGKKNLPQNEVRRSMLYHSDKGYFALRKGEWVLLDCKGSGGWTLSEEDAKSELPAQLYNLRTDSVQQHNLASKYPQRVSAMKKELEELKR